MVGEIGSIVGRLLTVPNGREREGGKIRLLGLGFRPCPCVDVEERRDALAIVALDEVALAISSFCSSSSSSSSTSIPRSVAPLPPPRWCAIELGVQEPLLCSIDILDDAGEGDMKALVESIAACVGRWIVSEGVRSRPSSADKAFDLSVLVQLLSVIASASRSSPCPLPNDVQVDDLLIPADPTVEAEIDLDMP